MYIYAHIYMYTHTHTHTHTHTYIHTHIITMEYCQAIKITVFSLQQHRWTLEGIMLTKLNKSDGERQILYDMTYM